MFWRTLIILALVFQPVLAWGGVPAAGCGSGGTHGDSVGCCPLTEGLACPCGCSCGPIDDPLPHDQPKAPARDGLSVVGLPARGAALPVLLPREDMTPRPAAERIAPIGGGASIQSLLCIWRN
jgi:hypothetical protein